MFHFSNFEIVIIYLTHIAIVEVKILTNGNEVDKVNKVGSKLLRRIASISLITVVVASLVFIPTLTSAATQNQSMNPQYISCSGQPLEQFSGYIYDQEGAGVGGVVLYIFSPNPYQGGSQESITTGGSGYWSASLISCYYDADVYWQNMSDGPYLTEETGVNVSSSYTVNVWIVPIDYNLTYEYPYASNVTVKTTFGSQIEFGVDAKLSGNAGDKFLGDDISGYVGTDLQLSSSDVWWTESTSPYMTYYAAGQAVRVLAANGSSIAYVEQYDPSDLSFKPSSSPPTNPLTEQDVINYHGNHQWWEGAPANGSTGWSYGSQQLTRVSAGMSVMAGFPLVGSVTFNTSVEFSSSTNNSISVTLDNSYGSHEAYFIVWQGGVYSNGTVYYGGPDYSIWYWGTSQP